MAKELQKSINMWIEQRSVQTVRNQEIISEIKKKCQNIYTKFL